MIARGFVKVPCGLIGYKNPLLKVGSVPRELVDLGSILLDQLHVLQLDRVVALKTEGMHQILLIIRKSKYSLLTFILCFEFFKGMGRFTDKGERLNPFPPHPRES